MTTTQAKKAVRRMPVAAPAAVTREAATGRIGRLSDPEMKPFVENIKHRIRTEPGFGRSLMQSAGILTPTGKLKKKYGG